MRLQLWASDSHAAFPSEVAGLPQPLLSGTSITYRARQPSTAQLQVYAPNSRSPFVLASTTLGVLGTSTLGGTGTFRLMQRLQVVAPDDSDRRMLTGFVTRIRRDPQIELPDGRVKWTLDVSDARWMFERDYVSQLTSAEVDSAYGGHGDDETMRYATSDEASTTTKFYNVQPTLMDQNIAALDASLFTEWQKVTLGRIVKDIQELTGAVVYIDAQADLQYQLETGATQLTWRLTTTGR